MRGTPQAAILILQLEAIFDLAMLICCVIGH